MAYKSEKVNVQDKANYPIYDTQSKMTNYEIIFDANVKQNRNGFYRNKYKDTLWSEIDTFWTIEPGFEHRTDLISKKFYGTAQYDWIIEDANNIADPIKEIIAGKRIVIPSQNRIFV